jgi:hypothetical protein
MKLSDWDSIAEFEYQVLSQTTLASNFAATSICAHCTEVSAQLSLQNDRRTRIKGTY